jgi:glutamine amidotransferase
MIFILDLEISNIRSLENSLDYLGIKYKKINCKDDIKIAKKIIIPGVGSFDYAMKYLEKKKYISHIKDFSLNKKKPILGICVGMQIFFNKSDEGKKKGLNFFDLSVSKLKPSNQFKVPNVGYSNCNDYKKLDLFKNLEDSLSFYFTNSYGVKVSKNYNFDNYSFVNHNFKFYGSVKKNNIFGVQFHPELSHAAGLAILRSFANLEYLL